MSPLHLILHRKGLMLYKLLEQSIFIYQLIKRAQLNNFTTIQHRYEVCILYCWQPMRYDNDRAILHDPFKCLLNQILRRSVQSRGRFVQEQDARVAQDSSSYGDSLLLTPAQIDAPLAQFGLKLVRELLNKRKGIRFFGCLVNLFVCY